MARRPALAITTPQDLHSMVLSGTGMAKWTQLEILEALIRAQADINTLLSELTELRQKK